MMRKKKAFTLLRFIASSLLVLSCKGLYAQVLMPSKNNGQKILLLNGTWKFKYFPSLDIGADSLFYTTNYNYSSWDNIQVPGNWELQGFAEPRYAKGLKEGTGLYRMDFTVPANWKTDPVYIAFDGVQYGYSLWVNGRFTGEFASSYNRQTFEITNLVQRGKKNTLAVKVTTRAKGFEFDTNDDWSLSGISRDVTLFSLPPVHFKDITVKTVVGTNNSIVTLDAVVEKNNEIKFPNSLSVSGRLFDPFGKLVKEFRLAGSVSNVLAKTISLQQEIKIERPLLWTAETPGLYTLHLSLKENDTELQHYTEHIGIREISWSNGVLQLNGRAIKLRGVDHHDLSPINGKSITGEELLQDLKLMREANINFIRTSHYPPQPRLLELCDSLGFYLMVEVPFGFGDEHLTDVSYQPILQTRANATIWRDKNHPSVIAWSIGNENPVTGMTLKTAKYVKMLDNTRPVCFPQKGSDFPGFAKAYPDSLDIYAPHYPTVQRLREYDNKFTHPMILTEYAHAMGLDFDMLDSLFEIISASPWLAGGAIWMFQDQGILCKAKDKVSKNDFTKYAWKDSMDFYDTYGEDGADGIVYANRIPQVDYWQVRKVYSPVKALDDTLKYQPGKSKFKITLINRYDFTNLSEVKCNWDLFADTTKLRSGIAPLNGSPHDTTSITINTYLSGKLTASYYYLKLSFIDKDNYQFYEKTYRILQENENTNLLPIFASKEAKPVLNGTSISAETYLFERANAGQMHLKNKNGVPIISDGPYVRVGRKPTMTELNFIYKRNNPDQLWHPFLLSHPEAEVAISDPGHLIVNYKYTADSAKGQVVGKVTYNFSDSGYINIKYHFIPTGKGKFTETGLSFLVPSSLTEFRWIGKGPYQAYPGKDKLSEFGFYHLNSNDIYFSGNRQKVDCALFTDDKGNGFALLTDKADISVGRTANGIIISHNSLVSGRFNKFGWPDLLHSFDSIKEITGNFTIVPLAGSWTAGIQQLFGDPQKAAIPFEPFYHSYDQ
ncbi:MAG: glycoside hydrolase family 2 TIM barrel-domain containing protein [Chitinophagaceae bacterium]